MECLGVDRDSAGGRCSIDPCAKRCVSTRSMPRSRPHCPSPTPMTTLLVISRRRANHSRRVSSRIDDELPLSFEGNPQTSVYARLPAFSHQHVVRSSPLADDSRVDCHWSEALMLSSFDQSRPIEALVFDWTNFSESDTDTFSR